MPRPPHVAASTETLSTRVFSQLAARARAKTERGERVFPLHVGDTYMEPPAAARAETQLTADHPGLHKYAPVQGEPALLDAIQRRLERLGHPVARERLQVVSGATSGLSVIAEALLDPGDEVLLPAPFWPLIRGILAKRGATPVQVPVWHEAGIDVEAALEAAVTERTVALYVNTPHNPTGRMLSDTQVEAMVRVAARHDLWLIADEAYQDLWFGEAAPTPIWAHPEVADRYVACHTLSKSYGLAGARVGYVHGGGAAMPAVQGVQTFSTYCAPRPMQLGAVHALDEGDAFLAARRAEVGAMGRRAAELLGLEPPAGGTFLFFDAAPYLREGETDAMPFLERALDHGVLLTPGASCGERFGRWVRLCFTTLDPETFDAALEALAPVLAK